METESGISAKSITAFCESFGISQDAFTPEERDQTVVLEGEIAGLDRQIAANYRHRTQIRKEVLMRLGLAAQSPEALLTSKGHPFGGKVKDDKGYEYVQTGGERAFHCPECQVWIKGKPQMIVFVNQQVAAFNCPLGEHPMGKGQFPFMATAHAG